MKTKHMNEMLEDEKDMKYIKWTQILRDMKKKFKRYWYDKCSRQKKNMKNKNWK
jgi:hypothetical protein